MSKLFYIIGASGAGKDSLINYCRQKVNGSIPLLVAHRYITRPANSGNENHIYVSPEEFELRHLQGLFAFNWHSHNLDYGIGIEIDDWMRAGFHVIVSGSREYLPEAIIRYPDMQVVMIDAPHTLIRQRLESRGREDANSIVERLNRNQMLKVEANNMMLIHNDDTIEQAGEELLRFLLEAISQETAI
jgi:ribose 1,5-bisphosphokinase